jgi:hypothetical protein
MPFDENAARIQTVSSVPCPHGDHVNNPYASRRGSCRVADVVCMRTKDGTWWQITELHPPMACGENGEQHSPNPNHHEAGGATWDDLVPGAVPHVEPEQPTTSEWDVAYRDGCCADWSELCSYHAGWNDGNAAAKEK